jgi:hypothetical protein
MGGCSMETLYQNPSKNSEPVREWNEGWMYTRVPKELRQGCSYPHKALELSPDGVKFILYKYT